MSADVDTPREPRWGGRTADNAMRREDAALRHDLEEAVWSIVAATFGEEKEPSEARTSMRDDVLVDNHGVVYLGSGIASNEAALSMVINSAAAWSALVVVRDVWDKDPGLASLRSVLAFNSADVAVVHPAVVDPLKRRLVDVYHRNTQQAFTRAAHDVELVSFLRRQGKYRVHVAKDASEFARLASGEDAAPAHQSTNSVLMVAPTAFAKNIQAAQDNFFMLQQEEGGDSAQQLQRTVLREYSALHQKIVQQAGVDVHLFTHEEHHDTPDAVFPNNWFSTHPDLECRGTSRNTLVLYPMKVPNRRKERRPDIIARLHELQRYGTVLDLSKDEEAGKFLEGTGSIVLDRVNRVAYVALSERSDADEAAKWAASLHYSLVTFTASDAQNRPIYHTNVMMAVGTSVAVVCLECVADAAERARLRQSLEGTGHEIVDISREQVNKFCGNVLELEHVQGYPVLVMSTQAYNGFTQAQRETLLKHERDLIHADIATLERIGGGGVRCTIAELF